MGKASWRRKLVSQKAPDRTTPVGLQKIALDSAVTLFNMQMESGRAVFEAAAVAVRTDMGLSDEYAYDPNAGRFVLRETVAPVPPVATSGLMDDRADVAAENEDNQEEGDT